MRNHPLTHLSHRIVVLIHLLAAALLAELHYAPTRTCGVCCIFVGALGLSLGRQFWSAHLASVSGRTAEAVALG